MGQTYYYFAASLPMIRWNNKPPLTVEDFLSTAGRLLNATDAVLMAQLLADEEDIETDNAVAQAWVRFSRNFKNEIAVLRAQQFHKDPQKVIRGTKENEPHLREAAHEASRTENLLEAQKLLDRTSWQLLDELTAGHYFDLEYLIVYGLKLKILERHEAYRSQAGQEAFARFRAMELPVQWAATGI